MVLLIHYNTDDAVIRYSAFHKTEDAYKEMKEQYDNVLNDVADDYTNAFCDESLSNAGTCQAYIVSSYTNFDWKIINTDKISPLNIW